MTKIILLRHGETAWNIEKVFRGQAEVPLTDNGREQAERAAEYLKDQGIHAIYTSPLERAVETAQPVAELTGIEAIVEEAFTGMDFGLWQGRPHREVKEEYPELFEEFHKRPAGMRIPEGETFQEVMDRGMAGLEKIRQRHPDQTVLIVTHRVICKLLVLGVMGLGPDRFWQIKLDTCAVCSFFYKDGDWVVTKVNENFFLDETKRATEDF
jgi:broad specificity phosphatase PhoE